METYFPIAAGLIVIAALALIAFGRSRRKIEAVTTDALLKGAEDALAEAQRLADARARSIAADQAALAADMANIAQTRQRLGGVFSQPITVQAGNAAPVAQ